MPAPEIMLIPAIAPTSAVIPASIPAWASIDLASLAPR